MRSLVLAAPPEGVVRRAHASLSENGPPLRILPAGTKEAWATFRLEAQPGAALKPTVSWFNPAGRLVGTVEKPNRPEIVSSARAGTPLASGLWRVELRAGGRLVKALAIRIAAS